MEPFTTLEAVAIPIDQPNLDTDQIIPARFLGKPRDSQVKAVFHDLRYAPDGTPRPEFVMNQKGFAGARIVVAERNFACGSSRENAVTVMVDNGLRASATSSSTTASRMPPCRSGWRRGAWPKSGRPCMPHPAQGSGSTSPARPWSVPTAGPIASKSIPSARTAC